MKKVMVFLIAALLLMLTGCSITMNEAWVIIEEQLEERYGEDFEITSVEKYDYPGSGGEWFNLSYNWVVTVTEPQSGVIFSAECNYKGLNVRDYYAQSLYTKDLEQKMDDIFSDYPDIHIRDNLQIRWCPSPEGWQPEVPFQEAFETCQLYELDLDIVVPLENAPDRADDLAQLLDRLHQDNNKMCLTLRVSDAEGNVFCSYRNRFQSDKKDAETLSAVLASLCQSVEKEPKMKEVLQELQKAHPFIVSTQLDGNSGGSFDFVLYLSEEDITVRTQALYEIFLSLKKIDPEGVFRIENAPTGIILNSLRLELTQEEFKERLLKPAPFGEITPVTTAEAVLYDIPKES